MLHMLSVEEGTLTIEQVSLDEIRAHNRVLADGYGRIMSIFVATSSPDTCTGSSKRHSTMSKPSTKR